MFAVWVSVIFVCRCVLCWTNRGLVKLWVFIPNSLQIQTNSQSLLIHSYPSLACYLFNKLFNSIACLLYFINLQLVIPGRTWILLYLGRTVYKRLWACLALYYDQALKFFIEKVSYCNITRSNLCRQSSNSAYCAIRYKPSSTVSLHDVSLRPILQVYSPSSSNFNLCTTSVRPPLPSSFTSYLL